MMWPRPCHEGDIVILLVVNAKGNDRFPYEIIIAQAELHHNGQREGSTGLAR